METSPAVSISLFATISPSEDPEKVLSAAMNVLGECGHEIEKAEGHILIRSKEISCLQNVHDQLRDRHVRAAASRLMLRMREGRRVTILLNRQAAAAGVVAVCTSATESPLGPLVMEIDSDKPESVIDWLTVR